MKPWQWGVLSGLVFVNLVMIALIVYFRITDKGSGTVSLPAYATPTSTIAFATVTPGPNPETTADLQKQALSPERITFVGGTGQQDTSHRLNWLLNFDQGQDTWVVYDSSQQKFMHVQNVSSDSGKSDSVVQWTAYDVPADYAGTYQTCTLDPNHFRVRCTSVSNGTLPTGQNWVYRTAFWPVVNELCFFIMDLAQDKLRVIGVSGTEYNSAESALDSNITSAGGLPWFSAQLDESFVTLQLWWSTSAYLLTLDYEIQGPPVINKTYIDTSGVALTGVASTLSSQRIVLWDKQSLNVFDRDKPGQAYKRTSRQLWPSGFTVDQGAMDKDGQWLVLYSFSGIGLMFQISTKGIAVGCWSLSLQQGSLTDTRGPANVFRPAQQSKIGLLLTDSTGHTHLSLWNVTDFVT